MKLLRLSRKLWRAGYRAQRGTWLLLCACLLCCCIFFLYVYLSPFVEKRQSIYYNLTSLHTEIRLPSGGKSHEELSEMLTLLEDSRYVDYYLLESALPNSATEPLPTVSAVTHKHESIRHAAFGAFV